MKAILEFNLPGDQVEFRISSDAIRWALTVQDLDNKLRDVLKYHKDLVPFADRVVQDIREFLHDTLDCRNISLTQLE